MLENFAFPMIVKIFDASLTEDQSSRSAASAPRAGSRPRSAPVVPAGGPARASSSVAVTGQGKGKQHLQSAVDGDGGGTQLAGSWVQPDLTVGSSQSQGPILVGAEVVDPVVAETVTTSDIGPLTGHGPVANEVTEQQSTRPNNQLPALGRDTSVRGWLTSIVVPQSSQKPPKVADFTIPKAADLTIASASFYLIPDGLSPLSPPSFFSNPTNK